MTNYCIVIPGPDDIYAMPSKEMAEQCVEAHNKTMKQWLEKHRTESMDWVDQEMIMAQVKTYPGSNAEHAKALEEFNQSDWILKDQS